MSGITCHVLDTTLGRPAAGVVVRLDVQSPTHGWQPVGQATTNADGRVLTFGPTAPRATGEHRVVFETAAYFVQRNLPVFYPRVEVHFSVSSAAEHYHIPLLLSPFGYSTYRGS